MREGLLKRREMERNHFTEILHLQRATIAAIANTNRSKKDKPIDVLDVHKIPELDPIIEKFREEEKQRQKEKDRKVLEKYKRVEKRIKQERSK